MEIGVDIVEIARIRASYERFGEGFMRRILTREEHSLCLGRQDPVIFLAGRFAAKEAISKALGTGFSRGLGWHSIEVLNDAAGKPEVTLHLPTNPRPRIKISISHDRHSAVAVALLE